MKNNVSTKNFTNQIGTDLDLARARAHTHAYIYIYIYILQTLTWL
jgi:hypothetical protein